MKADLFILQICDFLDDGDGHYRLHEPSLHLSRLPGTVVVDCHFYHRFLPTLVEAADVLVLPFVHNWDFFPKIEERRARGQITIFEANDYFYDVQPWNAVGGQWLDRAIQDEYRQYMAVADAVQTSTPELARRWRQWSRRVVVFENHLTRVAALSPVPTRPLTIGWGGSPGHFADWYHIAPYLQNWLSAHPAVHLAVMTNEFAKPFFQLPPERYHFTPFGSLADYLRFLPSLDIGLAPLVPSEYNRCRSDVKFLEYASHGVTGIYPDLEPYRHTVVPGKTGLLYKTEQELLHHLDTLATEAELRQRIRQEAHAYVAQKRQMTEHIGERLTYYRELLPAEPRGFELPGEVIAAAARDGNYLQLRPQEPEKTLLSLLQEPATREGAQALARLLDPYPNYLVAIQELGRFYNDLRDWQSALRYLERALPLNPKSARTLCEIARAHFGLNNAAAARHNLEAALAINPFYIPGWQYLLRLLALTKSSAGVLWAAQVRRQHPRNFALALQGAVLCPGLQGVETLRQLVEEFAPTLSGEERPGAATAFSQAIAEVAGPWLASAETLELVRRACEVFPQSARLADLLGYALRLAGFEEESQQAYVRALEIRRAAAIYRVEFAQEDGRFHYWQFAENIKNSYARVGVGRQVSEKSTG
jgi:tetratricopeptide (TPR) repeat protein